MIPPQETLSIKEENSIEELQMRMPKCLGADVRHEEFLYYRFLKARDFDVDKAEIMLRKHIIWRKVNQIDVLYDEFIPTEFFRKFPESKVIGYDKSGDMVRYGPAGRIHPTDLLKCMTFSDFLKHYIWVCEDSFALLKKENEKSGRCAFRGTIIFDMEGLLFSTVTSKPIVCMLFRFFSMYQDNYPERMKYAFIINTPPYFEILYSAVKPFLSKALLKKIRVFGRDGWKEKLLEFIDADVLPAFLGGNRTDPDGNAMCRTIVNLGGKIPECYFLSNQDRYFKDPAQVKKVLVKPSVKEEIRINVKDIGSQIQWVFLVKGKDIGFGIFLEGSERLIEIIPSEKYETLDGTEKGSYKCRSSGKYIIVFDNSYSWISSKEVQYCITVVEPKSLSNKMY